MNIEDCKVGLVVKSTTVAIIGDGLTINNVDVFMHPGTLGIEFKEKSGTWNPKFFEPANKFAVGDIVVWYQSTKEKVTLRGYKKDGKPIIEDKNGNIYSTYLERLLPLKKKDELKEGDKFIDYEDSLEREIVVLAKEYDNIREEYRYFGKILEYGIIDVWSVKDIKEIIYEGDE